MSNFKKDIAKKLLKRHKQISKSEKLLPFATCRKIGLVYDTEVVNPVYLNKMFHYFESEGKKVTTLGFVNNKELGDYLPNYKEEYFCKKDLNFWQIPKKRAVSKFINTEFDYLINLDVLGNVQLQAISTFSKARTRIGKHLDEFPFSQDFMIKGLAETGQELFREITKYIK